MVSYIQQCCVPVRCVVYKPNNRTAPAASFKRLFARAHGTIYSERVHLQRTLHYSLYV